MKLRKTEVAKRSIVINGHKTSVSLEPDFWFGLKEIAQKTRMTLTALVEDIDAERGARNLSSQIRLFVLRHTRTLAGLSPHAVDNGKPSRADSALEAPPSL